MSAKDVNVMCIYNKNFSYKFIPKRYTATVAIEAQPDALLSNWRFLLHHGKLIKVEFGRSLMSLVRAQFPFIQSAHIVRKISEGLALRQYHIENSALIKLSIRLLTNFVLQLIHV